jgi:hypothetical protein
MRRPCINTRQIEEGSSTNRCNIVRTRYALNPQNGLCLSSLHDAAFDSCLITLDENLKVLLSKRLKSYFPQPALEQNFILFERNKCHYRKNWPNQRSLSLLPSGTRRETLELTKLPRIICRSMPVRMSAIGYNGRRLFV